MVLAMTSIAGSIGLSAPSARGEMANPLGNDMLLGYKASKAALNQGESDHGCHVQPATAVMG